MSEEASSQQRNTIVLPTLVSPRPIQNQVAAFVQPCLSRGSARVRSNEVSSVNVNALLTLSGPDVAFGAVVDVDTASAVVGNICGAVDFCHIGFMGVPSNP